MTSPTPTGGPSTLRGVLYQMVLGLARCVEMRAVLEVHPHHAGPDATAATLILEPARGGDQVEVSRRGRRVEQIKTRSRGTWSLREVIDEVLPDLYRAADLALPDTTFVFVTDGSVGRWQSVRKWMEALGERPALALDDPQPLSFQRRVSGRQDGFWEDGPYDERRLFDLIVARLRLHQPATSEPLDAVRRKAWHLLSRLEFEEGVDLLERERFVDAWLLQYMSSSDRAREKRAALLEDLWKRASKGEARIVASEFFAHHRLDSAPLSDWQLHVAKGRQLLGRALRTRRIELSEDVRPEAARALDESWRSNSPILAICGAGGQGKTWLAGAVVARHAASDLVAMVAATGDARRDLDDAAQTLWSDVLERDDDLTPSRLRARLESVPLAAGRPVYVLIDGVRHVEEARALATTDLDTWKFRLVLTGPAQVFAGDGGDG